MLIRIPWWLHAGMGVALWLGIPHWLPRVASQLPPGTFGDGAAAGVANVAGGTLGALALLSLARSSWLGWRLRRRARPQALGRLSWEEFERLACEAFRRQGYRVRETASGADGGVDLVLRRRGETTLVQCKHWKTRRVGVPTVRELRGLVASEGADRGIVVCSGGFTSAAEAYAEREPVDLVDGSRLAELVRAR